MKMQYEKYTKNYNKGEQNMKKTLALILSAVMLSVMAFSVQALELDTTEASYEADVTEEAALASENKYSYGVTGLNISEFAASSENSDGTLSLTSGSAGLIIFGAPSETLDTAVYNKFVVCATSDLNAQLYFTTTATGGFSEANKISKYTYIVKADGDYWYYVYDLTTDADYTGDVKSFMFSAASKNSSAVVKDFFLTDALPATTANVYHYPVTSLRNEGLTSFVRENDGSMTLTAAKTGNMYLDHPEAFATSVYNKLVIKANNNTGIVAYYNTTESGGWKSTSAYSIVKSDEEGYYYYVYDFSALANYAGNVKLSTGFMLASTENASMNIKEMYLTDTAPVYDGNVYMYNIKKLRNEALTSYTVCADGSVDVTAASVGNIYFDHPADTLDASTYNKLVVLADNNIWGKLYWNTTDNKGITEAKTLKTYTEVRTSDGEYTYYVYDLSQLDGFTGYHRESTGLILSATKDGSANVKEMYLTDTIPDTGIYTYTYAKSSLRPEGTTVVYSDNGDGSFNATVASTGTVYVDHPGVTLDVSKYNKFVLLATGDLGNEFWYKTTDSSWKAMLRSAKIKADDEYYYYVYDLSTKGLTGTFAQSTGFMMGFKEAGTIKIKNVFLTNSVPESDAHEYHYGLKNVRSEGYSSITQSNSAITLTAANTGNLYLDHVEPLDCSDYNKLVLKATVNPGYKVYYKTTADGGIAENRTVSTYTTVKAKDGYSYYVYDLSASSLYTGEIAKTMGFCLAATGSGTTTISDIYVTDTVPSPEYDAPYSYDEYSMRVSGVMGMRFMASVTLAEKAECDEYGFIVTRADMIDAETDLTFDLDTSKYVSGVAYDKDGDIDIIYKDDPDGELVYFTGVLTGIPQNKSAYNTTFVVRPYVTYGEYTFYGTPRTKSLYDVALLVKNNTEVYNGLSDDAKATVDGIISIATAE